MKYRLFELGLHFHININLVLLKENISQTEPEKQIIYYQHLYKANFSTITIFQVASTVTNYLGSTVTN